MFAISKYLYQDTSIQFEIKLSGVLSLGTLPIDVKSSYGSLIALHLCAPNHQHCFNMRLGLAIDRINNTAYMIDVEADPDDAEYSQFHNAYHTKKICLATEKQARNNLCLEKGHAWKFGNNPVRNNAGKLTDYKLHPGDNCISFASENALWCKRATFADHHVWVTSFHEKEMFGGRNLPN